MRNRFKRLIKSEGLVLVDFYADWCQPCQQLIPILKEVKDTCQSSFRVVKVNVDQNPFIANEFHVKNIPTLIIFKSGIPQWTGVGIYNASELKKIIRKIT